MTRMRAIILLMFAFSSALSVFWGFALERAARGTIVDFKIVYYGARCLIEHHDPYNEAELMSLYLAEGGKAPTDAFEAHRIRQVVALQVYFPTAFIYIAPVALLPWPLAHVLWAAVTVMALTAASFLMWLLAQNHAPGASFYLICFILANCGILFAGGNPAGVSVGLCVIAAWCFLEDKYAYLAVICFAVSLALKPHDSGFVWLYFLLAGGLYRKRALQTLVVTFAMAVPTLLWIHSVSPHWLRELSGNLSATAVRGGITDPGPSSLSGSGGGMMINLQTVFSVFRDEPHLYNPATYLICGSLLLIWTVVTLRARPGRPHHLLALAAIAPLSMLPVYHRPHDAKLLILTLPACALLLAEGKLIGKVALVLNSAAVVLTSDFPLAILAQTTKQIVLGGTFRDKMRFILMTRPMPLILLALGIFYLWIYARRVAQNDFLDPRRKPTLVKVGEAS